MKTVIFCGGRGSSEIIQSLATLTNAEITLVVNAYDDGKSTGKIREYVGGFLGPSDIRKNIANIAKILGKYEISEILEHRIDVDKLKNNDLLTYISIEINELVMRLDVKTWINIQQLVSIFIDFEHLQKERFDYCDCAFGNILFAGAFIAANRNFNIAVDNFQKMMLSEFSKLKVMNITNGANLYLHAQAIGGEIFNDEALIVENDNGSRIKDVYLVKDKNLRNYEQLNCDQIFPEANTEVLQTIKKADLIIYGPGTQASSLLPSYLTRGVINEIYKNEKALKLFISNLIPDFDDPLGDVTSRIMNFVQIVKRTNPGVKIPINFLITHVFSELQLDQVPDIENLEGIQLIHDNWIQEDGKHLGPAIVRQLNGLLNNQLDAKPGFVSVVVPVLNEEKTVEYVLKNLSQHLSNQSYPFEIIVVDGGSTDNTLKIVNQIKIKNVLVLSYKKIQRGEAIRIGINRSRGDVIGVFPADNEYLVLDLSRALEFVMNQQADLIIGTRNTKVLNVKDQIMKVYSGNRLMGFVSFWGGLLISISNFVRTKKFVSDPLCGIKVFKRYPNELENLEASSVDLDIELIRKFTKSRFDILEIPVSYAPRSRKQGKKTNISNGLHALYQAMRKL